MDILEMLDPSQLDVIEEELSRDTKSIFVEALISEYCKDPSQCIDFLSVLPKIVCNPIVSLQKKINQYSWAVTLLLDKWLEHVNFSQQDEDNPLLFSVMLHIAWVHFPSGNCDEKTLAEKDFFSTFVRMLKRRKAFDYKKETSWQLLIRLGCRDWLISVIQQNIDRGFDLFKD